MDNFIVSARKYRPDTFKTVVGQTSITATLKSAISKNHLAHAYLFFGPRGVGKTTCARIFAKTINCSNISPDFEACNTCDSCRMFNESRSYNIHELDAASNNSVDDIRNLTDQVRIPPQVGKYSVYIIDEVHMLSANAFNAFLKTLEEPPRHAIFILATTEKHKIIPTILSRCQIFDFNRIEVKDIVEQLIYIASKENIIADENALNVIATKADGAMRDALSIFDQIVSFSGNSISYQNVIDNLNILDYEYYFKLVDTFLKSDYQSSLLIFNEILNKGFDGQNFISGLSKHLRDVLVCRDMVTIQLLEVGADIREKYKEQSVRCESDYILELLEITNKYDLSYKSSNNKRLHIEIALMQLASVIKKKSDPVAEVKNTEITTINKPEAKIRVTTEPEVKIVVDKKPEVQIKESQEVKEPEVKNILHIVPEAKLVKTGYPKADKNVIPSITEALNGILDDKSDVNIVAEEEEEYDGSEIGVISEEALREAWKEIAEKYKIEQPRLATILENNFPVIGENNVLTVKLANPSQKNNFNEIKHFAIPFLREKLKINYIKIEFEIDESLVNDMKPYTQEEKIKHISEKYPLFGVLKDKMKLDYD